MKNELWLVKVKSRHDRFVYYKLSYGARPILKKLKISDPEVAKLIEEHFSIRGNFNPKTGIYSEWTFGENCFNTQVVCGSIMEELYPELKKMRANTCKKISLKLAFIK